MYTRNIHAHLRLRDTLIDLLALLLLAGIAFSLGACGPVTEFADEVFTATSRGRDGDAPPSISSRHTPPAMVTVNRAKWVGRDLIVDGTSLYPATINLFDAETGEELATTHSRMTRIHGNYWTVTIRDPGSAPRHVQAVVDSARSVATVSGKPVRRIQPQDIAKDQAA